MFTIDDVAISISAEPEHLPVRGNYIVSDDADFDKKCENEIIARVEDGDEWAWCIVKCTVTPKSLNYVDIISGRAFLGGCSYKNKEEFIQSDSYNDLVDWAIDNLNLTSQRMYNGLKDKFASSL
jgi:hypothetical protein